MNVDRGTLNRAIIVGAVLLAVWIVTQNPREARESRAPVTFRGEGIMATPPARLSGDYSVRWTAEDTGLPSVGCYHSATLHPTEGRGSEQLGSGMVDGEASGTTNLYGLAAGSYYVDAASGCAWTVVLTPV